MVDAVVVVGAARSASRRQRKLALDAARTETFVPSPALSGMAPNPPPPLTPPPLPGSRQDVLLPDHEPEDKTAKGELKGVKRQMIRMISSFGAVLTLTTPTRNNRFRFLNSGFAL